MTLVDSSVWINHFRKTAAPLAELLQNEQVVMHPAVIGELALGVLKNRSLVLRDLELLPQITPASDKEILEWIERHRIFGKGIGWIDVQILLSCILENVELWTVDKPLANVARSCGARLFR